MIRREVTPAQLGLAGAAQLILLVTSVTEKGKTSTSRLLLVTSRPAAQLAPAEILGLRSDQWGIETICHQRLDVSLHEDNARVRSPNGAALLALLSRISLALFEQDRQQLQPVRDKTYPVWSGRLKAQPRPMLDRLLKRCLSP